MKLFIAVLCCSMLSCFPSFSSTKEDISAYIKAFKSVDSKNFGDNNDLIARTKDALGTKILLWYQYTKPRNPASFEEITSFILDNPGLPKQETLVRNAESLINSDIDKDKLKEWFVKIPPTGITAMIYYIKLLDEADIPAYINKQWDVLELNAADEKFFYNTFKKYLSKDDVIIRVNELLWQDRVNSAKSLMQYVPTEYKNLFLARIGYKRNMRNVASLLAKVPSDHKENEGLLFDRLKWMRKKEKFKEALTIIDHTNSHKTHPDLWWSERAHVARHYLNNENYQKAYEIILKGDNNTINAYAESQWMAGWIALSYLGKYEEALEHFMNMKNNVSSQISKARGHYWIARVHEIMENHSKAWSSYKDASEYPTTFYGQAAIRRAEIETSGLFKNPYKNLKCGDYIKGDNIQAIYFLNSINRQDLITSFALKSFYIADNEHDVACLMSILNHLRLDSLQVSISRKARTKDFDLGLMGFPVPSDFKVPKNSDKALLLAVTRQESGFDTNSKSPKGARGLMQIMPATAKNLSVYLKKRYSISKLVDDKEYNISLGNHYLNSLNKRYDKAIAMVLSAYNAGPTNVSKWIKMFGKYQVEDNSNLVFDEINWIEHIPFGETRNYVQRVMENLWIYEGVIKAQDKVKAEVEEDKK